MMARDLGFVRGRTPLFFKRTILCLPISRTTLQEVDQPQSLNVVNWKNVLRVVGLHIDLLILGVGEVPAVDIGFRVPLVLPHQVPSCEDSSGQILLNF